MDQTVNLTSSTSVVRIHLCPPKTSIYAKFMYKCSFFFAFLYKYSSKNAFLVGFGEQFGEQNRLKVSYFSSCLVFSFSQFK